jgi:endonuclease
VNSWRGTAQPVSGPDAPDTLLGTVHGILAAQLIKPQARVLANDRGISCVTVDYDMLRGLDSAEDRLF